MNDNERILNIYEKIVKAVQEFRKEWLNRPERKDPNYKGFIAEYHGSVYNMRIWRRK